MQDTVTACLMLKGIFTAEKDPNDTSLYLICVSDVNIN